MIRQALFVARKDLLFMLRERETILWVFVMPLVFMWFIGTVTGGFGGGGGPDYLAMKAAPDAGFLADQLEHRLRERDYEVVRTETDDELQRYSRRLTVPAAFTDSVLAGHPVTLQYRHRAEGFRNEYESVRVGRAVYTILADLVVSGEQGRRPTPETFARLNEMPRAITVASEPAGELPTAPHGFQQTVPGTMVMFTLLIMTTSGAILLVIERRQGLLRRLAYTPLSRLAVVLGKLGGKLALGLVQIGFAMLAGTVFFGMEWGSQLGTIICVMIVYGALMATVGVLLGSLARTEGVAAAVGVISANVLGALGGCWWPIEVAAPWMQKLQLFLPTGWAMDALHKLISFGHGPASVAPHIVGMLVATCLLVLVTVRVFRYD